MPPIRETPKWTRKDGGLGYIENRNGYCEMRYKGHRKACEGPAGEGRLRFVESNKKQARIELEAWIAKLRSNKTSTAVDSHSAFKAFWDDKMKRRSTGSKKLMKLIHSHFFPEVVPFDFDDPEPLEIHIRKRLKILATEPADPTPVKRGRGFQRKKGLTEQTIKSYASRMETFLTYCQARRWISSNPFALIDMPEPKKKGPAPTYTMQEFVAILAWFTDREDTGLRKHWLRNRLQYPTLWLMLLATAMRISEVLALRWSEYATEGESTVSSTEIAIRNTKTGDDRFIPLTGRSPEVGRIRAAIATARPYAEENDGWVFPWRTTSAVRSMINKALKELGIPSHGKPIHKFRATAEAIWLKSGMDPMVFVKIAGHGYDTYRRHYEALITSEDVEKMLDRTSS